MRLYDPTDAVVLAVAKIGTIGAAASVTTSVFGFDDYLVAFFGVGFTTLGMSAAGAMFSFAWGTRSKSRLMLFFTAGAATFIGASAVTGIPAFFPSVGDVREGAQPVVGFFYALFTRWAMPIIVDIIPMLIRRWFNIPSNPGNNGEAK